MIDDRKPTDLGPVPAAPPWCLPGATPLYSLADGEPPTWTWVRNVSEYVSVEAVDRISDGRIVRGAPQIFHSIPEDGPVTIAEAGAYATALTTATEIVMEGI